MRPHVEPPPTLRCMCGSELRLNLIEPADRTYGKQQEIFVCTNCSPQSSSQLSGSKHSSSTGTRMWLSIAEGYRGESACDSC